MDGHAELRFCLALQLDPRAHGIVLNMDDRTDLLRWWSKAPRRLVGVIHLPPSAWTIRQRLNIARLSSVIVLWHAALPEFEALIGPGRIRVIPHGVDTSFFRPPTAPRETDHLLCCGQYLRDFPALEIVFNLLLAQHPGLRLTVIVPRFKAAASDLEWCRHTPGVTLLSGVSDEALLYHLRSCTLLLLPLSDAGANNTVLEALSCGLPIATNDVGGIRDYGGGSAFPVAADRHHALAQLALDYLSNTELRAEIAQRQRTLAEMLDWDKCIVALRSAMAELTRCDNA
jgi:glycosyltransferase involved in cell wall biosynthesis